MHAHHSVTLRSRSPLIITLALAASATAATAQTNYTCHPGRDSNEARLLAFFATPIAFSAGGMLEALPPGHVRVAFEASYVPSPSREMQQPEACYTVKKSENTDLSPVFPRPRVALGLPGRVVLEASYLPPITVADAEPNLGSVALSRPWLLRGGTGEATLSLLLRAHATFGRVRGSITCPEESLQQEDVNGACYGSTASSDTYKPNMVGGEAALVREAAGERWGAYGLVGATALRPRFQVGFRYLTGAFDDTKISVDMNRVALGAGGWYRVGRGAAVTAELYSVPVDATTIRIGGAYTFQ
jgi:hypothetical protein